MQIYQKSKIPPNLKKESHILLQKESERESMCTLKQLALLRCADLRTFTVRKLTCKLQIIYSNQNYSDSILFLDLLEGTFRCFVPYEDCKCELTECFWQGPSMAPDWLQQSVHNITHNVAIGETVFLCIPHQSEPFGVFSLLDARRCTTYHRWHYARPHPPSPSFHLDYISAGRWFW